MPLKYKMVQTMALIRSEKWIAGLSPERKKMSKRFTSRQFASRLSILLSKEQTNRPFQMILWTGRSDFTNGLAALVFNPFVKSPINVGISGEWGMGKLPFGVKVVSQFI
ncbi:hypothetical protein SUGI_0439620 [Cryptomeria japonica]|nr:hypothetical protein SUGI_0439620 [Cryptomeria japonica]